MKNKIVAGLLAVFLGGFGVHKFYLGKYLQGVAYLVFCWTYIPALVALIEGIYYFFMSDDDFQEKYGGGSMGRTFNTHSSTYTPNNNIQSGIGSRLIKK